MTYLVLLLQAFGFDGVFEGRLRCLKRSRRLLPLAQAAPKGIKKATIAGGSILLSSACCLEWSAVTAIETAQETGVSNPRTSFCRFILRDLRWFSRIGPAYTTHLPSTAVHSVS